jgi:Raf kinase inhibitor-like YbhB/YbcL family protein
MQLKAWWTLPFCLALLMRSAVGPAESVVTAAPPSHGGAAMGFTLTSTAFSSGGNIPAKYTCEGQDASPPLAWSNPPEGARNFALIADDPDAPAGIWVHWVIYDIPATVHVLSEGLAKTDEIPGLAKQGINDFRRPGYGGPCPPPGKPHRYFFRLYALNSALNLKPQASRSDVDRAMQGKIVGKAELMGKFKR